MYAIKNTKQNRLESLKYQFDNLEKQGYKKQSYKDVTFFVKNEYGKFYLSVFIGTSTKQVNKYYYRSEERMQEAIDGYKKSADYREQRKQDEKGNKKLSGHAAAAKAIREELKKAFPAVKFSVVSESFSMGNSVHINWTDGATTKEVESITDKYQYGHFNGMEDIYENTNSRDDIPQAKYVSCSRSMSDETKTILLPFAEEIYKSEQFNCHNSENMLYRLFCQTSFPRCANPTGIAKRKDIKNGMWSIDSFYEITFDTNKKPDIEKTEEDEYIDFAAELLETSNFEIIQTKHTIKGFDLWVVKLLNRVSKDEFNTLLNNAKSFGGWYSSFNKNEAIAGFQFKNKEAAESFANQKNESVQKIEATDNPTKGTREPVKNDFNKKTAEKWAKLAETYQRECDKKRSELEHASTNTPKKNREYNSKRVDADILEDASRIAAGLSLVYESGNVEPILNCLQPIKSKSHLMPFIAGHESNGYYDSHRANKSSFEKYGVLMVGIDGIITQEQAQKVFDLLHGLNKIDPEQQAEKNRKNRIKELKEKFKFQKVAGFFPTPPELVEEMVNNLKITNGQTILEPSAGFGNIAESVRLAHPHNTLKTVEINSYLSEILELKGFDCNNDDFLTVIGKYDRIIMNPPFENGQDIDHVRHAYDLLNEGGRIVSIMSAGAFQNSNKKFKEFQTWIDEIGADYKKLPEKSFKDAFKSTNVNTYLVIIDK